MTSLIISEARVRAMLLQFFQEGYNRCLKDFNETQNNKIQIGSLISSNKKEYHVIVENDDMTFGNCPKIPAEHFDRWSLTSNQGVDLMLADVNYLIDCLDGRQQLSGIHEEEKLNPANCKNNSHPKSFA